MTTFFTSDTHFGHKNIITLGDGRPFRDITHMNEMIVHNWNALVRPDDTVYHLGDVALGPIEDSLKYISRLNGRKVMITGNHDRPFPPMSKFKDEKIAEWTEVYKRAGFDEVWENHRILLGDYHFALSHFPYDGDHTREDRYNEYRLRDLGIPLIHGHTHGKEKLTLSKGGTKMVHVGMDAWNFAPVSAMAVIDLIDPDE